MAIKAHYLQNKDGTKFYPYSHADATYTKYGEKVGDVLDALEEGKIDKEDGKSLSTNDYTDSDKKNLSTAYEHSQVAHARTDATKVEKSTTNGNIKINGNETAVYTHPSGTNPHGTTKNDIGLGNVNNTSDANKPVSTAQKTAIDKALTDAKAYTDTEIAELINGAPSTLDTLKEIADAMAENESIVKSLDEAIGTKANQTALNSHTGNTTVHITATERTNWNDANTKKHEHSNKSVLDGITSTLISTWNNITNKLDKTGDASNTTNTFSVATTRANLTTGEKLSTSLGKLAKWFSDLKTVAFTGSYNDLSNKPTIPSVGNGTITITQNGTTKGTFTTNQSGNTTIALTDTDTNTTYSNFVKSGSGAKAGLVPAPSTTAGTTKYLREDGTWTVPPNTNTTYSNMTGATSSAAGKAGLVPAPASGKQTSFLRGDGTWVVPTNTTYSAATQSAQGLMSAADKTKLDGITSSADAVSVTQKLTSGTEIGTVTVNGTGTKLYAPTNTDTHYTTGLKVGASATATANAAATNGNVHLNVLDNTTIRDSHNIVGSGATTVTSDANGKITISSTNTTYTHPTSSGNKHIPSGGSSGQILRWSADGTAVWGNDNNTTYSAATTSANGLMSSTDKTKLEATNIAYGTCSTAAATAAKVITISGNTNWKLTAGSIIIVKFSATNTAQNPTFNVNGTGAKSVWYNTAVITTSSLSYAGYANRPMMFAYDGTQFVFAGWSVDSNSTYSNASLGQGYGTCATAEATVEKAVTLSSYTLSTGGIVAVKFTYAVPASATMNINSKGAKAIYYKGSAITANIIKAGDIGVFIYNGTQYHLLTVDRRDTEVISATEPTGQATGDFWLQSY